MGAAAHEDQEQSVQESFQTQSSRMQFTFSVTLRIYLIRWSPPTDKSIQIILAILNTITSIRGWNKIHKADRIHLKWSRAIESYLVLKKKNATSTKREKDWAHSIHPIVFIKCQTMKFINDIDDCSERNMDQKHVVKISWNKWCCRLPRDDCEWHAHTTFTSSVSYGLPRRWSSKRVHKIENKLFVSSRMNRILSCWVSVSFLFPLLVLSQWHGAKCVTSIRNTIRINYEMF